MKTKEILAACLGWGVILTCSFAGEGGQAGTQTHKNEPTTKPAFSSGPTTTQKIHNGENKIPLFRVDGKARNICFVIDRSGSMLEILDFVKAEMIGSINAMGPDQNFHVIFTSSGVPIENLPKKLVPPNNTNKQQMADFMGAIVPEGQSDAVKAIERAFQVTNDQGEKAQLIYFVNDWELRPQKVGEILQKHNHEKAVKVVIRLADENKNKLFDLVENATNICFVIDRSVSMLEDFNDVKVEMIRSIKALKPDQNFHVIFFSSGEPVENLSKKLVPANAVNKQQVVNFLRSVGPEEVTDPAKAIERAFQVTNDKGEKVQLIYVVTDWGFPAAVGKILIKYNHDKKVKFIPISVVSEPAHPKLEGL